MENEKRKYSKVVYALCAFFLGGWGIHSFIAGKYIQGILFIVATLLGIILSFLGIGFIIFSVEWVIIIAQIIMALSKTSDQDGKIS